MREQLTRVITKMGRRRATAAVLVVLLLIGVLVAGTRGSGESNASETSQPSDAEPVVLPDEDGNVTVPDVLGLDRTEAEAVLATHSLRMLAFGTGPEATAQTPASGRDVPAGTQVIVRFGDDDTDSANAAAEAEADAEEALGPDPYGLPGIDDVPVPGEDGIELPAGYDPSRDVGRPYDGDPGPPPTLPKNPTIIPEDFRVGKFFVTFAPKVDPANDARWEFRVADASGKLLQAIPVQRGNGCQTLNLTYPAGTRGEVPVTVTLWAKVSGEPLGSVTFTVADSARGINGRIEPYQDMAGEFIRLVPDRNRRGC